MAYDRRRLRRIPRAPASAQSASEVLIVLIGIGTSWDHGIRQDRQRDAERHAGWSIMTSL
jgi:hypothetical protein